MGAGPTLHYCLRCGREFSPAGPDVTLCPDCGGPDARPQGPIRTRRESGSSQILGDPRSAARGTSPRFQGPIRTRLEPDSAQSPTPTPQPPVPTRLEAVPVVAEAEWQPGQLLAGLYEVKGLLGRGGMGAVFRVHHRAWNIDLAVKRPLPDAFQTEAQKQDFVSETETWVNLGLHPHIVTCFYVRTIDGVPCVFAECVEGGSLRQWIATRRLACLDLVIDTAIQLAWALAYAHGQGLVHRDVKPDNVLLTPAGTAKVTDFGLARAARGMTPAYASPEQAERETQIRSRVPEAQRTPLTLRSDLWSWGLSVLELFAGRPFWVKPEAPDYAWGQIAPDALADYQDGAVEGAVIPTMPPALADLLRQCFRPKPDDRPQDMLAIAAQLQAIYQQEVGQPYPRQMPNPIELRADSLNNKALSLLDLGRQREAEESWEQALQLEPNHPLSAYHLGLVRWRAARATDAVVVNHVREACGSHPADWQPRYLLSQVQLERGDYESAAAALEQIGGRDIEREEVAAAARYARRRLPNPTRLLQTLEGHDETVWAASLSADGRRALSGGEDGTMRLWDTASGECLRTVQQRPPNRIATTVLSVSLSADAHSGLSCNDAAGQVHLWDLARGRLVRAFDLPMAGQVCLRADGRYALGGSGDRDGTIMLWDVPSGRCLHRLRGHADYITDLCFSGDGRHILSGSNDGSLRLWEASSGECLRLFKGHELGVASACLSRDGERALSGGDDQTVRLWDTRTGACLRTFEGHTAAVLSARMTPDGRLAISGGYDRTLRWWDISSGRCVYTVESGGAAAHSICLSADGRLALAGGEGGRLTLWAAERPADTIMAPFVLSRVVAAAVASSSREAYQQAVARARALLRSGDAAGALRELRLARAEPGFENGAEAVELWHSLYPRLRRGALRSGWLRMQFAGHEITVRAISVTPDGQRIVSIGNDSRIRVWEAASGRRLHEHGCDADARLSPDGSYAVFGNHEYRGDRAHPMVTLLEVPTWQKRVLVRGAWAKAVYLSEDGRWLVSGGNYADTTVRLWHAPSGHSVRHYPWHGQPPSHVRCSPDGRYVLAADTFLCRVWEAVTGEVWEGGGATSICISADGRQAIAGREDGRIEFWAIPEDVGWRALLGPPVRVLQKQGAAAHSLALSLDGRHAASGSADGRLRVWDLGTGHCLRTFEGHVSGIGSVCFSPDASHVISGGPDEIKMWALDWELEDRQPADWDEGARPFLQFFLSQHTPCAGTLPQDGSPTEEEITLALTRRGRPVWTEDDFRQLLYTLGCAGYGWLRPEGVRRELETRSVAARRG